MLELGVLGLLKERDMHGYELRKQLTQRLGLFWSVSFGSLYPTLRRLEKRGAIHRVRPPAGTTSGRRKHVYRITAAGEQTFLDLLTDGANATVDEDKFSLRLAFFRYLAPEIRIRLLERRRATLEQRLDEGRESLRSAKRGKLDSYTLSLMRHGVDVTERDIAWLDELIAAERSQGEDPPPVNETDAAAEPGSDEHAEAKLQTN